MQWANHGNRGVPPIAIEWYYFNILIFVKLLIRHLDVDIMYDLHSHILPGIDDGPKSFESSVEMASVAADCGTTVMIATPHRKDVIENFSIPFIQDCLKLLNKELLRRNIGIDILLGMENHLDLELPDAFSNGEALTLAGSRYALIELPFFGKPNYMEDVLYNIQARGLTPVLVHPERIEAIQKNPSLLSQFVNHGMLTQVTAGSIVGYFGIRIKEFTQRLLKDGLVHIIASDTHSAKGPRSPLISEGLDVAKSLVGEEKARSMVVDTPRNILKI